MRHLRVIIVALVLAIPLAARAQSVPLFAVDVTAGGGRGTLQTTHTYYGLKRPDFLRAAATLRLGTAGPIRPILVAEYNSSCPFACGDFAVCYIAPVGSCSQHLPDLQGAGIGAGAAAGFGGMWLVQATGGIVGYWDHAKYLDATLAFSPIAHFALVGSIRHVVGRDARGDDIWFFPRSFGIRIH
jgi:hypothetical protein